MSDQTALVPLSHSLGVGQRDKGNSGRDESGTTAGTTSLKALAAKVLRRDTARDNGGTAAPKSCPTAVERVGQDFRPVPSAASTAERASEQSAPAPSIDDLDERAAIVEYGARIPRRWAEGFAALSSMPAPHGFSPERWHRIVDAAGAFLDRWAAEAIVAGWTDLDVFGADAAAPDKRFDCMGLVLLLDRLEIVSIDPEGADLRSPTGAPQRYRRRPLPPHTVSLWDLARQ